MSAFEVYRGDTLEWTGAATTSAGAAQSLANCVVFMTAKTRLTDTDADALWSVRSPGSGIVITDEAAGTFSITVAPSYTASLTRRTLLYYDVQIVDASGDVYTVDSGTITVLLDATVATT